MANTGTRWSKGAVSSLLSRIKLSCKELAMAIGGRDKARIAALLREGSPLDASIRGVLYYVFVALLLAPVVIVPAYYLAVTLAG